jgi:translation initiation factor 1A
MPKKGGRGGKKGRKRKNHSNYTRELAFKEEGQEYAKALKMLGNGCVECYCFDQKKRMGKICGTMRRRVWISPGDIVLVSIRPFNDSKCDIILKYFPEEAKQLKAMGELPYNLDFSNKGQNKDEGGMEIRFDAGSESEEEEDQIPDQNYVDDLPPGSSDEEYWEEQATKAKVKQKKKEEEEEVVKKEEKKVFKEAKNPLKRKKFDVADSDDDSEESYDELADI